MKNYILIVIVSLIFVNCSTEDLDNEAISESKDITLQIDNLDVVSFMPKKAYDNSSRGKYVGIFGHSEIKYLHGKIFVNAGNNGRYSAQISLVDGDRLLFRGNLTQENIIKFKGTRGSFIINIRDFKSPSANSVNIDNQEACYIQLKKARSFAAPLVSIGTYEETGNESNFYGNWDLIGDGDGNLFQEISQLIITHLGSSTPIVDNVFESTFSTGCSHGDPPRLFAIQGNGAVLTITSDNQQSLLGNVNASWNLLWQQNSYFDEFCNNLGPDAGGNWSWNGRTGKIIVTTW